MWKTDLLIDSSKSCFGVKRSGTGAMSGESELTSILSRRQAINDALDGGKQVKPHFRAGGHSVFAEFHEFTRKQIKQYETEFIK